MGARARGRARRSWFSLGHTSTQADVTALVAALPEAVDAAASVRRRRRETGTCRRRSPDEECWPRCRAASTPPSLRRGRSTPATTSPACTWRCPRTRSRSGPAPAAAAPRRTPTTPGGPPTCSGFPFYVWDLSDRFAADVVDDFVAEYAAGRTPNPCLRCNEKIKFAAVLDRARGAGLRRGLHRPLRAAGAYRQRRRAAPGGRRRQGPVLRARRADPGPAAALAASRSAARSSPRSGPRPPQRGLAVADKPDSHDICFIADGDTAGFLTGRLGARAGRHRRPDGPQGRRALRHPPVHRRPAPRSAPGRAGRRRPAALRAGHLAGDQHRHRRARATRSPSPDHRDPADLDRCAPTGPGRARSSCGPTAQPLPATVRRRRRRSR